MRSVDLMVACSCLYTPTVETQVLTEWEFSCPKELLLLTLGFIQKINTMKKIIGNLPLDKFQIHPQVQKNVREKNLSAMNYTMKSIGQITPVKVIEKDDNLYIIDGDSRLKSARQVGLDTLKYEVVEVQESKIMEFRLLSNAKVNRGMIEMCLEAEHILTLIGKSQGKKRSLLGFQNLEEDNNFGEIGKDRYDLTCALLGIELKGSTLRKLMYVFWSEYNPNSKSKLGIIELLDDGRISIDKAYSLLKAKEVKKKINERTQEAKLYIAHSNIGGGAKPYQIFNKSSLKMDEIPDNSLDFGMDSHPYYDLRDYRNQDDMKHGKESTLQNYFKNFKSFNEEKYRKLKPGGVLVTIIGETYRDGYQSVCSRAELALEEIGFKLLDVVIWVKSNQRYAPHPLRFQNSYERIVVAYKPGAEPFFNNIFRKGSVKDFKAKTTSNGGYYIANPETSITNVITTPTHNSKVFKAIDPNFQHDAPAPEELYKIFIEAYSRPGDTILDSFLGSGTIGVGLTMGRKVIGYDVDPLSIEFSQKRFEWYLKQGNQQGKKDNQNTLSVAA